MSNNQFIGRRVSVGLSVETTPGTAVAPSDWARHLSLSFKRRTTKIENNSALGRPEAVSDSAVVEKFADGVLSGKVGDITIGYLLYNAFGSLVTTDNADTDAAVKNHTFNVAVGQSPKTLTVTRVDPLTSRRHSLAAIEELDFSFESGDWVKVSASLKAKEGANSADVAAYDAGENEFTSKHVTVKLASTVAGLGAATALEVKKGNLKISRPVRLDFFLGSDAPLKTSTGDWKAMGELTLQYDSTDLEELEFANTRRALLISLSNTDVTIGAAARPKLDFTAPQAVLSTFDMSDDLDEIVEQTVGFNCELSQTDGYALRAVLTNTKAAY